MKISTKNSLRCLTVAGLVLCMTPHAVFSGEAGSVYVSSTGGASCDSPDVSSEIDISVELPYDQWLDRGGQSSSSATLDTADDELDHINCTYSISITETSDSADVFTVSLEGGEVAIDSSNDTDVTVNISVDLSELASLPSSDTYDGSYDLVLTASPK